jgi:hypothetical protein
MQPPGKNNRKYGVGAFDFQIVSCCSILELNYVNSTITSRKCPHTWIVYVNYLPPALLNLENGPGVLRVRVGREMQTGLTRIRKRGGTNHEVKSSQKLERT